MKQITVGFKLMVVCFPLKEKGNWMKPQVTTPGSIAIGPLRLGLTRETAWRGSPEDSLDPTPKV